MAHARQRSAGVSPALWILTGVLAIAMMLASDASGAPSGAVAKRTCGKHAATGKHPRRSHAAHLRSHRARGARTKHRHRHRCAALTGPGRRGVLAASKRERSGLTAPTRLAALAGDTKVALSWGASSGGQIAGYLV